MLKYITSLQKAQLNRWGKKNPNETSRVSVKLLISLLKCREECKCPKGAFCFPSFLFVLYAAAPYLVINGQQSRSLKNKEKKPKSGTLIVRHTERGERKTRRQTDGRSAETLPLVLNTDIDIALKQHI